MKLMLVKRIILTVVLLLAALAPQHAHAGSVFEWAQIPASAVNPGTTDLRGIWGTLDGGDLNIFIVGQAGKIFHYANGSWSQESTGETRDLNAVYGFGPMEVIAAADVQRTLYYYDGAWTKRSSDALSNGNLYSIWGTDPDNAFAAGKLRNMLGYLYNVIYIDASRPHPANIGTATPASGIEADRFGVWGTAENNVYMAGAPACKAKNWLGTCTGGYANISRYNGSSWSHVSTGYDSTTLYGIWGTADNDIFAVGQSGTILHYNGITWAKMTSGTNAVLRAVWGMGSDSVFAVGDGGIILRYNGVSWETLESGTSMTLKGIWGTSPTDVYAVGSSGTILHGVELPDADEDGIADQYDNCPAAINPGQEDDDEDSLGNVCDNCPAGHNLDQLDSDGDGIGDACDILTCSIPSLNGPSGSGIVPRPTYSWQKIDGVVWYNVQVWSERYNNFAASQWFDPAVICDSESCSAPANKALFPGRYWWWLNIWHVDRACGFKLVAGNRYKEFIVQACAGPNLLEPNDAAPVAYRSTPPFVWSNTEAESYAVQIYMPGDWIKTKWYDAAAICSGGTCSAYPNTCNYLGGHWWWLITLSSDCGYQVKPDGKSLYFTVQ